MNSIRNNKRTVAFLSKTIIFIILPFILFTTCIKVKDYDEPVKLSVSSNSLNFEPSGGQQTFSVTSNGDYWYIDNPYYSWLSVSPHMGYNDIYSVIVTVIAEVNTSSTQRTETITIRSHINGVKDQEIKVTQTGITPVLSVSPNTLSFSATGEQKSFTITSNVNWSVNSNASWLTVNPSSGSNNGMIYVTASANTSTSQRTATITINSKISGVLDERTNVTQAGLQTISDWVLINGVKWATRNVDRPGTFAATQESAGMFYQWNRKIGWSSTDPMINSNGGTTWDGSLPTGDTWAKANDPSPAGYRVPTLAEIQRLINTTYVSSTWTIRNGVNGRVFTDRATGNSIFMPAAGYRYYLGYGTTTTLSDISSVGYYWSSTHGYSGDAHDACYLYLEINLTDWGYSTFRFFGNTVRPVAE